MMTMGLANVCLILIIIRQLSAVSYNQPKYCSNASWNSNATVFATNNSVGSRPYDIFINTNNTVFVADRANGRIQIWLNGNTSLTNTISGNLSSPFSLFVTNMDDIYVDNGYSNYRVDKWTINATTGNQVMNVSGACFGSFVDTKDTLYCSILNRHQVVSKSLVNISNMVTIIAGTGLFGSAQNQLSSPYGIFIDITFDLYVADCGNDRIQYFPPGRLNGTTLAGNGSNRSSSLNCPTDVTLDADKTLYIVDFYNHRIVQSTSNSFRCLVGCSGGGGSTPDKLYYPHSMAFDSSGNIFVTDTYNHRIQKFLFAEKSCEQFISTQEPTSTVIISSKASITNPSCSPPTVELIPGTSTLTSLLQFRRSQDFYISSNIEINCNDLLSITIQWTVNSCTATCFHPIQMDLTVVTTASELYIPARTLAYGIYELKLSVTMNASSSFTANASAYVQITQSSISANLVQLGTSMITSGYQLDLKLDPGTYSVDPDQNSFNSSNWKYEYYCRIYGSYMFPNSHGLLLTIENSTMDPHNPSCFSNRTDNQTAWKYGDSIKSSLTILAGSLQPGRMYQFMVYMESRRNSATRVTGYGLVKVEYTRPQLVVIGCVISTMCAPNMEFQLVNPTTQVALFSMCVGNYCEIRNITWNVYYGSINASLNFTKWTLLSPTTSQQNSWFFGTNTSNFTATNQLFLTNPSFNLWRFEVLYSFVSETSSSAFNFVINQPPYNGSCSISPSNGTTSTIFDMSCPNWFDQDGIKDYSLYIFTTEPSQKSIIAFSTLSVFQVHLPAGNDQTSMLHLIVSIRDQLDCVIEYNMSTVRVIPDSAGISDLINYIQSQSSSSGITNNLIIHLLAVGDQNTVGQVITSLSQQLNKMNSESFDKAVSSGIPAASISVSPLGSQRASGPTVLLNQSALIEFKKELNSQANVREYLMTFTTKLRIMTSNNIKLRASSLAQLTKATNQLTRTTLTIVCDRCYQLSLALNSMATRIAYEDVQAIASELVQCATNVLNAVNGPLQQRTNVLDLDSSRAATFPDDYETDLESDWSNSNLFVDGNDFSWQSIEKGRNLYYQKQLANQIKSQVNEIISLLTAASNIHLNIGQDMTVNTPQVFMSLEATSVGSLSNKQIKQVGDAQIRLPSNFNTNLSQDSAVSIRSIMEPLASFGNSKSSSNTNVSTSVSLSITDQNGHEVSIEANPSQPIEIIVPRDPNLIIPAMVLQNVTSSYSTPSNQLFHLHYVNITSTVSISVHLEIHPLNSSVAYLLIYKFDQLPQLNSSIHQIDGWTLLCPSRLTNESLYTHFIDNQQTTGHRSLVFGLRELSIIEMTDLCSISSVTNPPIMNQRSNFTSNYELRTYTSGCYYLDRNHQWQSDGLRVGPLTNHYQTQCFSTHLTPFAGGFIVLPEPINWSYVFANADFRKNKTVYLTVICISLIYIILIIYARFKDKKDLEKLGVTPLPDNHPLDEYFYQIIVVTGHRKDAGTKSNVHFVIYGDNDQTHTRTLADPHRQILQRGAIDAFIMAVPKSLGLLNCIRIWHDNSDQGSSSSWFLKYVIVRDLQTMAKFHFISQRWFAVEKDDGKIERVLPVAGVIEKSEFSYLLSKQAYHSVSDGHLWFSIFSRPPSNVFTRVQRCTCCFVLFYISMFLNIMYYDLQKGTDTNNSTNTMSLSLGPLHIAPEQVGVGVIVELLSLIPSLVLVQVFRRLRSRRQPTSSSHQVLQKIKPSLKIQENDPDRNQKKKKRAKTFPWWCVFIVYGLCVILAGLSIFFIIARGIEFGDLKTQQWLTSIIAGAFSSILLTQPLKILCLAIFFAFFCRKPDEDEEMNGYLIEDQIELCTNEEYLHSIKNQPLFIYRPPARIERLNEGEIVYARQQRLREIHMWSIIRETFLHLSFLSFLFILTYSNRSPDAFLQVDHLRNYLLNSRQTDLDYTKISTMTEYWKWLEESFVSNLRAQQWYNGDSPRNLSGFMNDKSNRFIGWTMMRQLRIRSGLCAVQKLDSTCEDDYNSFSEEKKSFEAGWGNETTIRSNSTIDQAFQFRSQDELDTYAYRGDHGSYNGGGYVYEFRGRLSDIRQNLSELHRLGWIDSRTRAVIIQLSLYNPNVQLFTSAILLTEFLPTGGIQSQSQFEPMNFYVFTSTFQLVCTIIYMVFIIYFMMVQVRLLIQLKWKYVRDLWSWIELGIIICSWMSVRIYVWRYHECSRIGELFKNTNGHVYINLQLSTYLDSFLTFLYGFCCFFSTVRLMRLCRFNQRLDLFVQTLKRAAKELVSFAMMFSIVFFSFICLFYFLFQSKLWSCSSVYRTAETLLEMSLMKFDAQELSEAAAFLGPLCFSLFVLLVVFVCLSMFLSIINDSFRQARDNISRENDEEICSFMFNKFQRWSGLKQQTAREIFEERDARMRSQYLTRIECFAERIDQLLDAISRIHMSQRAEISRLEEL